MITSGMVGRPRVWFLIALAGGILLLVLETGLAAEPEAIQLLPPKLEDLPHPRVKELHPPRVLFGPPGISGPTPGEISPSTDLATCYQIARLHQPAINAARASYAAAVARAQSLEKLRVPSFLARDLPIRKKQAAIGVMVNEAAVHQVENNIRYAVTYCYLAALYATEQEAVTTEGIENLGKLRTFYKDYGKEGASTAKRDFARIQTLYSLASARVEEARQGRQRALSALREAMGVGPDAPVGLSRKTLFTLEANVDLRMMIDLAVSRRPELVQAANGAEVSKLEVCAQELRRLPQAPTFASGSDIHVQPLPAGSFDTDYKPAAVGPEMPANLTGSRADRVEVASIYAARAEVVVEKIRNLIVLETEQAYFRWSEASRKLPRYREASKHAQERLALARQAFEKTPGGRDVIDPLLNAAEQATTLRLAINQTRFELLLGLAGLERVTANGFVAGFETAPAELLLPPVEKSKEEKDKTESKEEEKKDKTNRKE